MFNQHHLAKTWKQPKCPLTDEWIKKMQCTHTMNITYYQKECNNAICSNLDRPRDYHTKQSKSEGKRQIPYEISYMWDLKYYANQHIYETKTDSQI